MEACSSPPVGWAKADAIVDIYITDIEWVGLKQMQ